MSLKLHTWRFNQKAEYHFRRGSVILLLLMKHFFHLSLDADESVWHLEFCVAHPYWIVLITICQ